GRRTVAAAVDGAFSFKLTPHAALVQLNRARPNSKRRAQQAAPPADPKPEEALNASDFLQKSVHASFTADGHYSDWLAARKRCGPPDPNPGLPAPRGAR